MKQWFLVALAASSFTYANAQGIEKKITLKEDFKAERQANGDYKLFIPKGSYQMQQGRDKKELLASAPIAVYGDTLISAPKSERLYFMLTNNGDTTIITERKISVSGPSNFRDIGGIPTKDGKHVVWGHFYRADELSGLKDAEFPYLNSLGIKQVYDLRSQDEVNSKKDHLPETMKWIHYPIFEEGNDVQMKAVMQKFRDGSMTKEAASQLLVKANQDFATKNLPRFQVLVKQILDADSPSLFHCTAGKDRTGFTSALLLSVLNVDRETILDEYLMTNYYTYDKIQGGMDKMFDSAPVKIDKAVVTQLMMVDKAYLEAGFNEIIKKYGNMDNFIREGLKITDEQRLSYQKKYTY